MQKKENESPGWTQLKLPGQAPSSRCGHTITSGGHYLLLFGGHGTGGWLSRYDIYYNDCIVLDRVSVQWKRLPTCNEPPLARAYHSMTCIGSRYLLFGGFDGKSTFGDMWWLVTEDDPIAKRPPTESPPKALLEEKDSSVGSDRFQPLKESREDDSPISELQKRLEISVSVSSPQLQIIDESEDTEFLNLASGFIKDSAYSNVEQAAQVLRDHWRNSLPKSLALKELSPLLRDYQRLITRHLAIGGSTVRSIESALAGKAAYKFYHTKSASQLRIDDIPQLLAEYKDLLSG